MSANNIFNLEYIERNKNAYNFFTNFSLLSFKKMYFWGRTTACAGNAISKFLHNIAFSDDLEYQFFNDSLMSSSLYLSASRVGIATAPYQISEKLFKTILSNNSPFLNFAIVRNPYDRIISSLNFKLIESKLYNVNDKHTLLNLFRNLYNENEVHFISQSNILHYHHVKYDFILRYEDLENDMQILFPQYKNIQGIKQRQQDFAKDLLKTDEFVSMIQKFYADDFRHFGYSYDVKEINHYDNSVLPRSLDKWQNPSKYPCDISILSGNSANITVSPPSYFFNNIGDFLSKAIEQNRHNIPNIIQKWKNQK